MPFLERGIDDLTFDDIERLVQDQIVEDSQVELKQEIEELKRPTKLSWQRLVEDLLESWANAQRNHPQHPSLRNGT